MSKSFWCEQKFNPLQLSIIPKEKGKKFLSEENKKKITEQVPELSEA